MPIRQETVQVGTTHRLTMEVVTDPAELGRAAGFQLEEAIMTVGATRTDLEAAPTSLVLPAMIERAYPPLVTAEAALTAAPAFSAGLGPMSENVYILTVDDSSPFTVGDFLRGKDKPAEQGRTHEVLAIPDGTTMHVHSSTADFDIVDGDTVEKVTPTGTYIGTIDLAVDDFVSVANPTGELHLVISTKNTGDDPVFSVISNLTWTWALELDLTGRGFKAG